MPMGIGGHDSTVVPDNPGKTLTVLGSPDW